jgi:hypothetical protein
MSGDRYVYAGDAGDSILFPKRGLSRCAGRAIPSASSMREPAARPAKEKFGGFRFQVQRMNEERS